jgi:hypothetical protein
MRSEESNCNSKTKKKKKRKREHKKKSLGFTSVVGFRVATHDGNKKTRKVAERDCKCVGAYKNDCHEYYALSSGAFNDESRPLRYDVA